MNYLLLWRIKYGKTQKSIWKNETLQTFVKSNYGDRYIYYNTFVRQVIAIWRIIFNIIL